MSGGYGFYDGPDDYDAWEGPIVDAPAPVTRPSHTTITLHQMETMPRIPGGSIEQIIRQLGWSVDHNWRESLATFRSRGLDDATLGWLAAVAVTRPLLPDEARWRYFCGCCWRTINRRDQITAHG